MSTITSILEAARPGFDSKGQRSLRAVGLVLMPPAMAVVAPALFPGTSAHIWTVVARFLFLGLGVMLFCRAGGVASQHPRSPYRYLQVLAGVCVVSAALDALFPTSYTSSARIAVMAAAATIEEILFRVELPAAISATLEGTSGRARMLAGCAAAQISFAFTHLAVHGGITTGEDALEVIRLFGAGVSALLVYRVGGLFAASLVHAFLNYATVTSRLGMASYPGPATIVLWTLAATAMLTVLLARTTRVPARETGEPFGSPVLRPQFPVPYSRVPEV